MRAKDVGEVSIGLELLQHLKPTSLIGFHDANDPSMRRENSTPCLLLSSLTSARIQKVSNSMQKRVEG